MAAQGSTRANMDKLLRTVYTDMNRAQFNTKSILLQTIEREEETFRQGLEISVPLHLGQGSGIMCSSSLNLPEATYEDIERATFTFAGITGKVEFSGDFMEDASGVPASELPIVDWQMERFVKTARSELNVLMFGDGTGQFATIASGDSATQITVNDARNLHNNQRVDILRISDGSTVGGAAGVRITVNRTTKAVTLVDGTLSDGDGSTINANPALYAVYKAGSRNAAFFGLTAAISEGNPPAANYGGVDRTLDANESYRGNVLSSSSGNNRKASFTLIQEALDLIDTRGDEESDPNLIVCPHDIWRSLGEELSQGKRFDGDMQKLNGWLTAIVHGDLPPIVKDKHCPPNKMFVLDTKTWTIYQNDEGKWMSEDGAVLSRIKGRVAYEAAWFRRMQPVCKVPAGNAVIEDLAYTPTT